MMGYQWATDKGSPSVAATLRQKKTMVAHVAHSFARKTKFRNQKEAMISYGNEVMIKLRNFQSENSLKKFDKLQNLYGGLPVGYRQR